MAIKAFEPIQGQPRAIEDFVRALSGDDHDLQSLLENCLVDSLARERLLAVHQAMLDIEQDDRSEETNDPLTREVAWVLAEVRRHPHTAKRLPLGPIFGREAELQMAREWLDSGNKPCLVILGDGGIGKTFLLQHIEEIGQGGRHQGFFVSCSLAHDKSDLLQLLGQAIAPDREFATLGDLAEVLPHNTLLYLDGIDTIKDIDECLKSIRESAPTVRFVLTSRTSPPSSNSLIIDLKSLDFQDTDSNPVVHFLQHRIHTGSPGTVAADSRTLCSLAKIAGGIPLLIAIFAGSLAFADPVDLEQKLAVRIPAIERHADHLVAASLSALQEFLTSEDRYLLVAASLFGDCFNYEELSQIGGWTDQKTSASLRSLLQRNLVEFDASNPRPRYRLHDQISRYVKDHWVAESSSLLSKVRFCDMVAKQAEDIGYLQSIGDWRAASAKFGGIRPNIEAALVVAREIEDDRLAITVAYALARLTFESGQNRLFGEILTAARESLAQSPDPHLEIELLGLEGAAAARRGSPDEAEILWRNRYSLCLESGDIRGACDTLTDLAWEDFERGDAVRAASLLAETRLLAERSDDAGLVATVDVIHARLAMKAGYVDEATSIAVSVSSRLESEDVDLSLKPFILQNLCLIAREADNPSWAEYARQVLRLGLESDRLTHAAWALRQLRDHYDQAGDPKNAIRCGLAALLVSQEIGSRHITQYEQELKALSTRLGLPLSATRTPTTPGDWRQLIAHLTT